MASDATPQTPYEKLEAATATLEKERRFFEALMASDPVAKIANRIIYLVTFFQAADQFIPPYLLHNAPRLFPNDSLQVAATLYGLLSDIVRSARLAGYLCVKGIPEQALAALRGAIEQIGVYTQVWHMPEKHRFVPDSDSDDYADAFRSGGAAIRKQLQGTGIKFRFIKCSAAKPLSTAYGVLSTYFVHGTRPTTKHQQQTDLSCEFVDRASPSAMAQQFELLQSLMSMIYLELLGCIPKDDMLENELAPLSIISGVFLPIIGFPPNQEQPELAEKMLNAVRSIQVEP